MCVLFNWTGSERINTVSFVSLDLAVALYVLYTTLIVSQQGESVTLAHHLDSLFREGDINEDRK